MGCVKGKNVTGQSQRISSTCGKIKAAALVKRLDKIPKLKRASNGLQAYIQTVA